MKLNEFLRQGETYATGCTGDDSNLVFEILHWVFPDLPKGRYDNPLMLTSL